VVIPWYLPVSAKSKSLGNKIKITAAKIRKGVILTTDSESSHFLLMLGLSEFGKRKQLE
jgi:hypothetical protein